MVVLLPRTGRQHQTYRLDSHYVPAVAAVAALASQATVATVVLEGYTVAEEEAEERLLMEHHSQAKVEMERKASLS